MKKIIILIGIILLLNIVYAKDVKILDFHSDNHIVDLNEMIFLLYNTDFSYSEQQNVYVINITRLKNYTYRKCIVLRFLREHPEILARFPEIDDADSNIPMWKIDGINCLNTQGGGSPGGEKSGGGGGAAAPSNVVASVGRQWDILLPNSNSIITIKNEDIAFTKFSFRVKNTLSKVDIEIESLSSNPLSTQASDEVYQYLHIGKRNIANDDVIYIQINFRVPKTWLERMNINYGDVVLYRYNLGWKALETKKVDEDMFSVNYKTISNGFSLYAIGVQADNSKNVEQLYAPNIINWHFYCGSEYYNFRAYDDGNFFCDGHILVENVNIRDGRRFVEFIETQKPVDVTSQEPRQLSNEAVAWIVVAVIVIITGIGHFLWQRKYETQNYRITEIRSKKPKKSLW